MAIQLTNNTTRALREPNIEPNIIVKFEGLDTLFSARPIQEFLRINDPGFFIGGEGLFVGGLIDIEPDKNRTLLDSRSTTFTIRQQMNYDEGRSSSVSTMSVGLVDKDQFVSLLISPGNLINEILGVKAQIFIAYGDVSFFEDAIEIFKGVVASVNSGAGIVSFKINHPDNKKQVNLFKSVETRLTTNINATQTTIEVENGTSFLLPSGPLATYLRVGSELIQYTSRAGNTFTGITRGALGSTATAASAGDQVRALYALEDNGLDLALQIMMSGHGPDPIYENIPITSFLQIGAGTTRIDNAVYFEQVDVPQDYGLRAGDTVSITGATNGVNNVTLAQVDDVIRSDSGYYVVLSGVNLVLEQETTAVMSTFTQYNTLPDGMLMTPDEVDIDEHIKIRDLFLSAANMRIFIKDDEVDGKEFLDDEIYKPLACYSLPRKAKASLGYSVGPIPGEDIKTLDATNVKDPRSIQISRSSAKSFFNEVIYKYDDTPLLSEKRFTTGSITISGDSRNRIKGTNRSYIIESSGLRTDLGAANIVASNSTRILERYQFAAETIKVKALLRDTAGLEIGDIVVSDFSDLKVTDIARGDREFEPRLFEVQNKVINLKTGDVELSLLDTGFSIDSRFGLMSPTSYIAGVISQSQLVIGPDPFFGGKFGDDEFRKWESIVNLANPMSCVIRSEDFTVSEDVVVTNIDGNTLTLSQPATITITAGLYIEFTGYNDADTSDRQKLVYAYMTDAANFDDGGFPYLMI